MDATTEPTTTQVYRVYIRATPEAIWTAITDPGWTARYGYGAASDYDLRPGGPFRGPANAGMLEHGAPEVVVDGPRDRLVALTDAARRGAARKARGQPVRAGSGSPSAGGPAQPAGSCAQPIRWRSVFALRTALPASSLLKYANTSRPAASHSRRRCAHQARSSSE